MKGVMYSFYSVLIQGTAYWIVGVVEIPLSVHVSDDLADWEL